MIQTIRKAWGIPELRKKIVFTLLILLIFRLGNAIMVPYINRDALALQMQVWGTGLLGLYNVMSGGAFATATVFALSIQPYINSSIIIQLLTVAIPALERLARDGGEEGKKKIQKIRNRKNNLMQKKRNMFFTCSAFSTLLWKNRENQRIMAARSISIKRA